MTVLQFPNRPITPPAPMILTKRSCCHTPNDSVQAESSHRWHHWTERFKCAGFCLTLHVIYEVCHYAFW